MRIKMFSLAALGAAGLAATPAIAADSGPRVGVSIGIGNGYSQPYRGYGYDRYDPRGTNRYANYGYGQQHFAYNKVRELQQRVGQMRQDIFYFGRQGALSRGEYSRLQRQAANLQQRIDRMAYRGLNRNEYRRAIQGIRNLRQSISRELQDGRRYSNYGYGYRGDRDRYWNDDDRYGNDRRWGDRRYDRRDRDDDDWDD